MKTKTGFLDLLLNKVVKSTLVILLMLQVNTMMSQNWQWVWSETCTKDGQPAWLNTNHVDFKNNVYASSPYGSKLFFSDTSFHKTGFTYWSGNSATVIYDSKGDLTGVIDIYTTPHNHVDYIHIETDAESNLYLAASFTSEVFIQDTVFLAGPSLLNNRSVVVARLDPDFDLNWGGIITSNNDDDLIDFCISDDDYLYTACLHNVQYNVKQATFLGQHTSQPYSKEMNSIAKIDPDGNLVWVKEINSQGSGTAGKEVYIGADELIYLRGWGASNIFVDSDTLFTPWYPEVKGGHFFKIFNQSGELTNAFYLVMNLTVIYQTRVDANSNIYLSASLSDTVVIGNDTIVVPPGKRYGIIGKFSPDLDPIWYNLITGSSIGSPIVKFTLDEENLIFSFRDKGTVNIADTTLSLGNFDQSVVGEFNESGQLINIIKTQCSNHLRATNLMLDNCGDIYLGGIFYGTAILGPDTITPFNPQFPDGLLTKIQRAVPITLELGSDTVACESFTILAPEGFEYYYWNDSLINENWLTVSESGTYYLACATKNGCWAFDSIHVNIHPGFEISLGSDTAISMNDTIILSVPDHYEAYLWSDGTTTNELTIIGADYGIGTFPIWVQVADGPCFETDTIFLTLKDELGIDGSMAAKIRIFPNPFSNIITLELDFEYEAIEIYDMQGLLLLQTNAGLAGRNPGQIDLSNLLRGVYLLKVQTAYGPVFSKIIKI